MPRQLFKRKKHEIHVMPHKYNCLSVCYIIDETILGFELLKIWCRFVTFMKTILNSRKYTPSSILISTELKGQVCNRRHVVNMNIHFETKIGINSNEPNLVVQNHFWNAHFTTFLSQPSKKQKYPQRTARKRHQTWGRAIWIKKQNVRMMRMMATWWRC